MTISSLFAVIINVDGNDETGCGIYDVRIVDRYSHPGHILGEKTNLDSLDEAIEFAKGAVTAFMSGTMVVHNDRCLMHDGHDGNCIIPT